VRAPPVQQVVCLTGSVERVLLVHQVLRPTEKAGRVIRVHLDFHYHLWEHVARAPSVKLLLETEGRVLHAPQVSLQMGKEVRVRRVLRVKCSIVRLARVNRVLLIRT
jgi:hypothetical protein